MFNIDPARCMRRARGAGGNAHADRSCNGYPCADRNPDAICYTNARADRLPCCNRVTHANARRHTNCNTEGTNHVLQLCGFDLIRSRNRHRKV